MIKSCTIFLLIWLVAIGNKGYSQQSPVYSQYLFNALAINPAFAGSQDQLSVSAIYRNQWVNFEGAPEVYSLTGNTAIAGKKIGLGFVITNDQIGVHNDLSLYFSYAYRIKFRSGALAMGLRAGFNNLKSDYSKLNILDNTDPNLTENFQKFNPNFGTGIFYSNEHSYLGVSIPFLVNSKIFEGTDAISESRSRRYYLLAAGRVFPLSKNLKIKPSTLIRFQEKAPLGVDLNVQLIIKDMISIGNSYRSGDSDIINFEIQFNENFRLGYAYELVLSNIGGFTRGSHEFMINYRINIPGMYKGLPCPTYF